MTRFRLLRRAALLLAVGAAAASSISAQVLAPRTDRDPSPEVKSLQLVGVSKAVDATELKASIYTDATRCTSVVLTPVCRFTRYRGFEQRHYLNRQEFKRDVLRIKVFYFKHGYRQTTVDTTVTRVNSKQVAVRFDIVEGPPTIVADVAVTVDSGLIRGRRLRRLTTMQPNQPLDLFVFDSMRTNFQNELWDLGYADALIDTSSVVDEVARTARVQLRVVPNHRTTVGDIVIRGTDQVAQKVVRNSLTFRPGDLYKRGDVIESQRNLYESNLFRLAALEVPQTFDSVKTVNVVVREAQLHEARASVGFNTVEFAQTEARYTAYNLLGGARRLELSATAGNLFAGTLNGRGIFRQQDTSTAVTGDASDFLQPTWQASATLTQPSFLQRARNSLGIGAFAQRRSVPAVVIDRGYGGNLTYTRSLGVRAPASLTYRFEETRVEAGGPYFCVNFGVCDVTTIEALRSHQRLSPVQALVQVDRSDQPLNPTRGYVGRIDLEHASSFTASDYRYNRAYADGAVYMGLGPRGNVLASHVRIGFVRPLSGGGGGTIAEAVLHPRKRFYAGGSQSVRGFGENQLGPRILTLPHGFLVNAKTASGALCDVTSASTLRLCDPNTAADSTGTKSLVGDDKFTPRPLGGTSLLEGSVEYRFPLPFLANLGGAVFVDGAAVGERVLDPLGAGVRTLANLVSGTAAITPGFGIRYLSSVGPIRVDVGFNPARQHELAVVSEVSRNGVTEIVPLDIARRYSDVQASNGFKSILNRFTLHLSIGQAY